MGSGFWHQNEKLKDESKNNIHVQTFKNQKKEEESENVNDQKKKEECGVTYQAISWKKNHWWQVRYFVGCLCLIVGASIMLGCMPADFITYVGKSYLMTAPVWFIATTSSLVGFGGIFLLTT